jgi:5,10-methylene-tetrahydrofolate dehydrogenase/methenyl tetrahydrofolate cyclohydrolase
MYSTPVAEAVIDDVKDRVLRRSERSRSVGLATGMAGDGPTSAGYVGNDHTARGRQGRDRRSRPNIG